MRSRGASARRSCSRPSSPYLPSSRFSPPGGLAMRRGDIVLAALAVAAVALIAIELALGALSVGKPRLADPCTSKPAFSGGGLDGAVQRFALTGLAGAACELHTTREELVLSFVPAADVKTVRWDRPTI